MSGPSTIDFLAIAAAIAHGFDPAGVTPPTGADTIAVSTHLLPDTISAFPTALTFPFLPADWTISFGSRTALLTWPVRIFFDKAQTLPDSISLMYRWMPVLDLQFPSGSNIDLGLGPTVRLAIISAAPAIRPYTYNGTEYRCIEMAVQTNVAEPIS